MRVLVKHKVNVNPHLHAHMREILYRKRSGSIKNRKMKIADVYIDAIHRFFAAIEQPEGTPQAFSGDRSKELQLMAPAYLIPHRDDIFEMVMRWYIALPENYLGKTFAENLAKRMPA